MNSLIFLTHLVQNATTKRTISFGLFVSILLLTGCSQPNPLGRQAISGVVSFDGSPLDSGMIEFSPRDPAGHSSGALIQAGTYQIPAHQGLPPGEYVARITSPDENTPDEEVALEDTLPPGPQDGPRQPPPAKERIPADFNTKSKQFITVTTDGPNEFDFDIPATKKRR